MQVLNASNSITFTTSSLSVSCIISFNLFIEVPKYMSDILSKFHVLIIPKKLESCYTLYHNIGPTNRILAHWNSLWCFYHTCFSLLICNILAIYCYIVHLLISIIYMFSYLLISFSLSPLPILLRSICNMLILISI